MKLASEHKCTKCNSYKVRCTNTESLYQPDQSECEIDDYSFSLENEVYMDIICDNCKTSYKTTYDIVERLPRTDREEIK